MLCVRCESFFGKKTEATHFMELGPLEDKVPLCESCFKEVKEENEMFKVFEDGSDQELD